MKSKTIYFLGYISNKIQILSNAYHTMRLNKVLGGETYYRPTQYRKRIEQHYYGGTC